LQHHEEISKQKNSSNLSSPLSTSPQRNASQPVPDTHSLEVYGKLSFSLRHRNPLQRCSTTEQQ